MKVLIINSSRAYADMWAELGFSLAVTVKDADIICFTGGEDVTPAYYDAHKHPHTHNNPARDAKEALFFDDALSLGVPMVGICRGGQFLNVMNGGAMYQHVTKHTMHHSLTDVHTGESVLVSSTHHQMMKPSEDAVIVATANLGGEREWYEGQVFKKDVSDEDIEVVYYPHTQSLCFQPHPEFTGYPEMREYFKRCLETYILDDVLVP